MQVSNVKKVQTYMMVNGAGNEAKTERCRFRGTDCGSSGNQLVDYHAFCGDDGYIADKAVHGLMDHQFKPKINQTEPKPRA